MSSLNMWSAAGSLLVFNAVSPKYANLLPGLAYAIILVNSTSSDITTGTVTIETANAKPDDACTPDTWAPLDGVPSCDAAPGTVVGPATIQLSAQHPLKAYTQCDYSAPCPNQFIRVSGVPAGVDAIVAVTILRRTDFTFGTPSGANMEMARPV